MRTLVLCAVMVAASVAMADVDLSYTFTPRKTQLVTGERVEVDARVANAGPDAATDVVVIISLPMTGSSLIDLDAPDAWQCIPVRYSNVVTCTIASFAGGAEATFTATVMTPGQPTGLLDVQGTIRSASRETHTANNFPRILLELTAAPRQTDLQVSGETERLVREGSEVRHTVTVRNAGPDEARGVAAIVDLSAYPVPPFAVSGAGWTCETVFGGHAVCTRPALAAGASAPIELRFQAPQAETSLVFNVVPVAELSHDPTLAHFGAQILVGSRQNWRMMLVPLVNDNVPGANNSFWKTEMTMVIRADAAPGIQPDACAFPFPGSCPPDRPPLRAAFDPRDYLFVWSGYPLGQFVYIRAEAFDKVQMNARIFDYSREAETAGAEIPVPRDTKFTSDIITLLNIPVAPEYRHTLRIYDADARNGARVAIRLFADDGRRVTVEQTLTTPESTWQNGILQLPVHPAAVQVELGQLVDLGGVESLYVEVEPLDEGVKIWSFVSITNNATHHVTTVTPQ